MRKLSLTLVVVLCLTSLIYPLDQSQSELSTNSVVLWSVEEDAGNASGCTNVSANNYDVNATTDDGSCDFDLDDDGVLDADEITGCMNHIANNYQSNATDDDGSCDWDLDDDGILDVYEIKGCMNINATNYNPNATDEDGTCDIPTGGFQLAHIQTSFKSITVNNYNIYSIKFSPDGANYATQHQSEIIIWNTSTRVNETSFQVIGKILDFDWSPSGKQITTITSYNHSNWLDTYDLETQEITYFRIGQYSHHGDLEYSPDGSMISVSYNHETSIYNLSDNELIGSFNHDNKHYAIHHSVSWNPSGNQIAFSDGGTVNVYNVPELTEVWHSSYHGYSDIDSVSYSADGRFIISCTENGDVVLRAAANGYMMWEYTGYSSTIATSCTDIAWSPDLSEVAVSYSYYGYFASSVIIFSVEDGTLVDRIGAMQSYHCIGAAGNCVSVNGLDWHEDGDIVLTMNGENSGIYHWEFNQNLNVIFGCSNSAATNDDPLATRDDGSCYFYTTTNNQNPGYDYGGGGYSGGGYSGGGHSGTDIGFPAITDSNGGMGYLGPSGEEISKFCCFPLIIFIALFSMAQNLNKTKKLQRKDGDDKPKSKDKKMQ